MEFSNRQPKDERDADTTTPDGPAWRAPDDSGLSEGFDDDEADTLVNQVGYGDGELVGTPGAFSVSSKDRSTAPASDIAYRWDDDAESVGEGSQTYGARDYGVEDDYAAPKNDGEDRDE